MEHFSPKLIFQVELAGPENQKFHIICLLRQNFSNISAKENSFLYFPLQRSKISQIKKNSCNYNKAFFRILLYFFLYPTNLFLSFSERFLFITIFCRFFSFSSLERFWYLLRGISFIFFVVFLYFLDNI